MRFNNATKDEEARRNSAKKGQNYNQSADTQSRWAGRERSDEAFARAMGLNLDYRNIRSHNARLLR